eukprot:12286209-Alexandrium_andersonii.AAC.1
MTNLRNSERGKRRSGMQAYARVQLGRMHVRSSSPHARGALAAHAKPVCPNDGCRGSSQCAQQQCWRSHRCW